MIKEETLTYGNAIRWMLKGMWVTVVFFVWSIWKEIFSISTTFFWELFKLIHSHERLLCGFDGLLGGLGFAVWVWSDPAMPAIEKALMVGLGAMLGGMFGFISFQLVSIKWLKLVPKS